MREITFHVDLAASVLFGRRFAGRRTRASAVLCFASEGARSIRDNAWPHIGGTRGVGAREFFIVEARVGARSPLANHTELGKLYALAWPLTSSIITWSSNPWCLLSTT